MNSITCPTCHRTSYNPNDIRERYCANCNAFHSMNDMTAIFVNPEQPYARHVEDRRVIHEHRAPTDESVKLLRDMEAAAQAKLISITKLESNAFSATWHLFEEPTSFSTTAICRFTLNGVEHRLEIPIKPDWRYTPQAIAEHVRDAVALKLAEILTIDLFHKQSRTIASALHLK